MASVHRFPGTRSAAALPDDAESERTPAERTPLASEIGAAMAHELSGPITALLMYIEEIQSSANRAGDASLTAVVDGASREAERIRALILRLGDTFEAAIPEDAAMNVARNAIAWWARAGRHDDAQKSDTGDRNVDGSNRFGGKCLTLREQEVLRLVIEGHSNKEGAARIGISHRTFECHRARAMRKIGARNVAELVRLVMQQEKAERASEQATA